VAAALAASLDPEVAEIADALMANLLLVYSANYEHW
jgi:hypothetical protein